MAALLAASLGAPRGALACGRCGNLLAARVLSLAVRPLWSLCVRCSHPAAFRAAAPALS